MSADILDFLTAGAGGGGVIGLVRIVGDMAKERGWFGSKNGHDPSLNASVAKFATTLENVDRSMRDLAECQENATRIQERMLDRLDREVTPALKDLQEKTADIKSEQIEIARSLENHRRNL